MFEEVLYTLFSLLLKHRKAWLEAPHEDFSYPYRGTRPIARYGLKKMMEPQMLSIDVMALKNQCRSEYGKYQHLLKQYLSIYAYNRVRNMFAIDFYDMDIMLWSQIVYRLFFLFDDASEEQRKEIIDALKPLYFARSLAFDYTTFRYSVDFAEQEVKNQSRAFLSQKPYLLGLYLLKDHVARAARD